MNFADFIFETSGGMDKIAVISRTDEIWYADLWGKVVHAAGWIKEEIGENHRIILIGENSNFFIISYFAIIKSGNICIPLNPTISSEVLNHVVDQCESGVGFLHPKVEEKFHSHFQRVVRSKELDGLTKCYDTDHLDSSFDSNRLAEIIFTSGSTALPKGVMLSHQNLIANTESIISYLNLQEEDRMAVVLPFYYCYGLSLLHTHLKVGGSLVLNNTFMMLNTLLEDLVQHQCTGFAGVPSHFQIMLRKSRRFRQTQFPNLRYVTQAGGKLPDVFIRELVELFPKIEFFVMYGQTEATSRLSYLPSQLVLKKMGSIGKGIPGVKLEVIDKTGKPTRPGEIGEIVASGKNVMKGYLNDPDLTSVTIKDGKLFTGDIGKVDDEGFIYIVAREKEFLKVGGERISPKEVEEVITNLSGVIDCSVAGVEDDLTGEAIVAYVVLERPNSLTDKEIISYCTKKLSSGKVPKYIKFIDEIPTTGAGKKVVKGIDRNL